ncbi:hypothetical protein [Phenylobacterium sp.]|uniref:hypothetical protein n=1 Tax=Phenylobacterium sp. TaxID=1871053 RepID=UPI00272FF462|nr:hypothetical protein [Phenylobacterium sp.]MDP1618054.1 hypothetical protein [Phenylobacterium sp.]MDP1988400.1 hypothetical protein [Phenylobacterium sp.]
MLLVAAFLIWSLAFIALYGVHGVACAAGWASVQNPWPLRLTLIGLWLVMTSAAAAFALWTWKRPIKDQAAQGFLRTATLAVAVIGAVSTAWLGAPLFLVRVCA